MIELISEGCIPNTHNKRYIIDSPEDRSNLEVDFGNEAYCISNKTTYICNGSGVYVEKGSSGGGGGGGVEPLIVTLTPTSMTAANADKTNGEIKDALENGCPVWIGIVLGTKTYMGGVTYSKIVENESTIDRYFTATTEELDGFGFIAVTSDGNDENTSWILGTRGGVPNYIVAVEKDEYDDWWSDVTREEIWEQMAHGKQIVIRLTMDGIQYYMPLQLYAQTEYEGQTMYMYQVQLWVDTYSALAVLSSTGVGDGKAWSVNVHPISA